MTITRIVLKDFGVFGGQQTLDLSASNPDRPIVLVGGENGRGKTTILEAVFLVLYGKLSPFVSSSGGAYAKYLQGRVNDRSPDDTASVTVVMDYAIEGGMSEIEACRTWTKSGSGRQEQFAVRRDGWDDDWLSDNWGVYWTQMLPPDIAGLFFFDGERIEALADPSTSARVIRNSLHALFGISPLSRLRSDLDLVQKRAIDEEPSEQHEKLEESYSAYVSATRERERIQEKVADATARRAEVRSMLDRVERRLHAVGGGAETLKSREAMRTELAGLKTQIETIDTELRAVAGGNAPFLLIEPLVERTGASLSSSKSADEVELIRSIGSDLGARISQRLGEQLQGQHPDVIASVKAIIDSELPKAVDEPSISFPTEALRVADHWPLLLADMELVRSNLNELLSERVAVVHQTEQLESRLMALPAEESVRDLLEEESAKQSELKQIEESLKQISEELSAADRILDQHKNRYTSVAEGLLKTHNKSADAARVVTHARRTQELLSQLQERLVRRHISRLEIELSEKLAILHSKRLVNNVRILPDTFEIQLSTESGEVIPASRLSAGERQLLSLAVLWAVQSYSDRKMPMIVDTPLGRLDTSHRRSMVERFLTEASHQVIVLSTDSEVTPELAASVADSVSAQFRLHYESADQSTRIEAGYFLPAGDLKHEYQST